MPLCSVRLSSALIFTTLLAVPAAAQAPPPPPPGEDVGPASAVELLEEPELRRAGTNVDLDGVVVRRISGNLVRVKYGRREIFVAPVDPSLIDFLTVGAVIDVQGTLRDAPGARQARLIFAVDGRAARRLERDRIYVDAWFVSAR